MCSVQIQNKAADFEFNESLRNYMQIWSREIFKFSSGIRFTIKLKFIAE